ncbi:hypothetical protein GB937_005939 [Aspergillus fischeri]|nr:hypothetical protein GB937_005939 [Aspergillus fischeri]
MAAAEKRAMPDNTSDQSSKRRKGGGKWQKQQSNKAIVESGDWGVFVTCDMGREGKCIAEALDLFSQVSINQDQFVFLHYMTLPNLMHGIYQSVESASSNTGGEDSGSDEDEGDIEAQIKKEIEGLKPGSAKPRQFQAIRMEMPCVTFIRFDKSIDPEKLVHDVCLDAHANPEKKRCRWVQRMTPVRSIRKTLSVDLEAFAKEILKPHFHSGGPPKKYAIRPTIRGNNKFNRDSVIKTIADVVGPEHPVDLKNYDLIILVHLIQNVVGISVAGSDYDKLKRYNLAELYTPTPKPQAPENSGRRPWAYSALYSVREKCSMFGGPSSFPPPNIIIEWGPNTFEKLTKANHAFASARTVPAWDRSTFPCVPSLLYYDPHDTLLGSAFLVRQYIHGSTLQELESRLTAEDRRELDRQLGLLVNMIGQHTANSFGTLEQVALGSGTRSWREAFLVHFESILRDSEDVFVHLPYAEIRHQVGRLSPVLDEITLPRLVICDFGRPSAVLLDPVSKQLAGIAGFDSALWGDVYMGEIFEDPSPAVLDGFASRDIDCEPDLIRQLLYGSNSVLLIKDEEIYACYRSIHNITIQYYRERNSAAETEARRRLTRILTKMAAVEVVETRVDV